MCGPHVFTDAPKVGVGVRFSGPIATKRRVGRERRRGDCGGDRGARVRNCSRVSAGAAKAESYARAAAGRASDLLPFTGPEISRAALAATVRLAMAEGATIVPAFLARVPRLLPLDSPLLAQCRYGMPLIEAIEQRAAAEGIPVDSRVARGRTYRDALRRLLEQERFDRVIVSANGSRRTGLSREDLEWLLERVPAEILILRPAPDDFARISAAGSNWAF